MRANTCVSVLSPNSLNHISSSLTFTCLHSLFLLYRSELSLQPITEDNQDEQFECSEGFSYEDVSNQQPETRLHQTCRRRGNQGGVMTINIVPVKDEVTFRHTGGAGENFDVPFVLHLWPSILLRNLLPYPITYTLKVGHVELSLLSSGEHFNTTNVNVYCSCVLGA